VSEPPAPVGCFFGGANRPGEDHDKISTDRSNGGLIAGRSYVCAGPKWSGNRSVSTGHKKPEPLWLLWLLRSTPLCAWNALLCSRVSGPTLRLQALARLAMVSAKRWLKSREARGESGHCFHKQTRPLWVMCGRRPGKNFLTLLQHWSGAVMCPACLCGRCGRWP
jgi:hypothetical protein